MLTGEQLGQDELHIWRATLDIGAQESKRMLALLSGDEQARAARFHFDRDRVRYIAGRAQLRMLLSRYTGAEPASLVFQYGEHRKPSLAPPAPYFNLSHSGALAIYALAAEVEVGVDVELYDPAFAGERIPEHFFAPDEVAALRSLPEQLQPRAFLHCWTRKEAFIKARGDGLSLALDSFSVTLTPDRPAAVTRIGSDADEPYNWSMLDLSDTCGAYVAAVAAKTKGWLAVRNRAARINGNALVSKGD